MTLLPEIIASHTQAVLKSEKDSSWVEALREGNFTRALTELEREGLPNARERLWWIRSQLELKKVPLGVLTSPLEETFSEMKEDQALEELLVVTLLSIATDGFLRDQRRLALIMLTRAFQLVHTSIHFKSAEKETIRTELKTHLSKELHELKAQTETVPKKKLQVQKDYIHLLEMQLAEIEAIKIVASSKPEAALPQTPRKEKISKQFTSKSIIEHGTRDEIPVSAHAEIAASKNKANAMIVVGLVLSCAALLFFFWSRSREGLRDRLAMATKAPNSGELLAPEIHGFDFKSVGLITSPATSFENIQSSLDKLSKNEKSELPPPSSPPEVEVEKESSTDAATSTSKGEHRDAPKQEVAVLPEEDKKAPLLDPAKLSETKVEALGETFPSGSGVGGRVVRGPDGRLYGPPPHRSGGARELDGQELRGYEVNRFEPPKPYRTITETQVLEAPSLVAPSLSQLEANAKVQAVAQIGRWLEIRSTGGRVGYIYAQDAIAESN